MREFSFAAVLTAILLAVASGRSCVQAQREISRRDREFDYIRSELRRLDVRLSAIEASPFANNYDVDLIGARTTCLRQTLETLISTWPGRARLPEPCGSWPEWPRPGDSLEER